MRPRRLLVLAIIILCLVFWSTGALAQESLWLQKKYDLGADRYSEGLDFYNGFLWHTARYTLEKLDLATATDTDGDGDYDLQAERTWDFVHNHHSESSVWLDGELFNLTFYDTTSSECDDIYILDLNDDETYQWRHVGDGLGETNWGSCRDNRVPGESIIYTGHYDDVMMWFDPESGETTSTLVIPGLDYIEDLGMDRHGTVWASSFYSSTYPGIYRLDPDTGETLETFYGPSELEVIDGLAIRTVGDHDLLYVTGKSTPYIWEYLVPNLASVGPYDEFAEISLEFSTDRGGSGGPVTRVRYFVPEETRIQLGIFDVRGRLVAKLEDGIAGSGSHTVTWNVREAASSVYFCHLMAGNAAVTRKLLLLK